MYQVDLPHSTEVVQVDEKLVADGKWHNVAVEWTSARPSHVDVMLTLDYQLSVSNCNYLFIH